MPNWKCFLCRIIGHKRGVFYFRREGFGLYGVCRRCHCKFDPRAYRR